MSYVTQVLSSSKLHCGVEVSVSKGTKHVGSSSPLILQCPAVCWKRGREFLPILFLWFQCAESNSGQTYNFIVRFEVLMVVTVKLVSALEYDIM